MIQREVKIVDITGFTANQIQTAYNTGYGKKGWRIVQIVSLSNKVYLIAEKEL